MIKNTYTTTVNGSEVVIDVTFTDDQTNTVLLEAQTTIIGDETKAINYVPTFVKDLERNFPQVVNPEPVPTPQEGMMI